MIVIIPLDDVQEGQIVIWKAMITSPNRPKITEEIFLPVRILSLSKQNLDLIEVTVLTDPMRGTYWVPTSDLGVRFVDA